MSADIRYMNPSKEIRAMGRVAAECATEWGDQTYITSAAELVAMLIVDRDNGNREFGAAGCNISIEAARREARGLYEKQLNDYLDLGGADSATVMGDPELLPSALAVLETNELIKRHGGEFTPVRYLASILGHDSLGASQIVRKLGYDPVTLRDQLLKYSGDL